MSALPLLGVDRLQQLVQAPSAFIRLAKYSGDARLPSPELYQMPSAD